MKSLLLLLSLVFVGISSLPAQTSATPATKGAVADSSSTLTAEERNRALEYLKQTQKDFLASIDGVSEAQWKFKAAPDRWSIAETAEHIAVTEQFIWELVTKTMKSPATPEKKAEVKGKEEMIMAKIPDRSRKAQAPEPLKPTGRWATREAVAKDFESTRAKEIAYVTETKEDLRSHFEEHPAVKTLDAWQWLLFNGAHCKRHTVQILEVKADPNYPKS